MRFVRGWTWLERILGALCGALAGLIWVMILMPEHELKPRALHGRVPSGRAVGGRAAPSRATRQRRP
jgi:hypothetical protein